MSKTSLLRIFKATRKSIFSRPCLQVLVLYALICLAEGRPKTLKKCGRSESPMGRIIGGKYAQPGEYPWQVSLQLKKRYRFQHYCGGSILNEHYIVTAAHCIDYPKEPWMYEIITGLHQLSKKSRKPARKYKVTEVIVHERYSDKTYPYDIALVRTKEAIQFEDGYVNGICLPQNNEDPTGWAIVTGWGDTEEGGELSDVLQAVKVPIVSRKECFAAYDEGPEDDTADIVDSQICAGIVVRDSCQGDSGGPLVQKNKRGIYTLIGIVSYGYGCGQKTYPGVYTKVASFMDWLEENMN